MTASGRPVSSEPDRGWPVKRLLVGTVIGMVAGVQTEPPTLSIPDFGPVSWWAILPGVAILAFATWLRFDEERTTDHHTGRRTRWWSVAAVSILVIVVMAVAFAVALLAVLAACLLVVAGIAWAAYGVGLVRGAVVGVSVAGLLILIGRVLDERAARV